MPEYKSVQVDDIARFPENIAVTLMLEGIIMARYPNFLVDTSLLKMLVERLKQTSKKAYKILITDACNNSESFDYLRRRFGQSTAIQVTCDNAGVFVPLCDCGQGGTHFVQETAGPIVSEAAYNELRITPAQAAITVLSELKSILGKSKLH